MRKEEEGGKVIKTMGSRIESQGKERKPSQTTLINAYAGGSAQPFFSHTLQGRSCKVSLRVYAGYF